MAKPEKRTKARYLREQGWSVRAITDELDVSKSSVSRWIRDIELTDEQHKTLKNNQKDYLQKGTKVNSENSLKQRQLYQEMGSQKAKEMRPLHMMGCMLYWAEGTKDRNRVEFVNSDINMMKIFIQFLRNELGVPTSEISIRVTCHETNIVIVEKIERFWLKLLELPHNSLQKTQFKQGSNSRRNRLQYGICSIRVDNTMVVQHIFGAIQEYGQFNNTDWLS